MNSVLPARRAFSALIASILLGTSAASAVHAQQPSQAASPGDPLEEVVITAVRAAGVAGSFGPNPVSTVSADGLANLGGAGGSNSFLALKQIPGVIASAADPYGLSFTRALNVRGKSDFFLGRTLNGLPVTGVVGGADLLDYENVRTESIYEGPILANQGFGFSNASGVLDQTLRGPAQEFGALFDQGFGADSFRRSFVRLDSGQFASGTSLFVSGSHSEADKWKGAGSAWRNNVALGVSQKFSDAVSADLLYVHNIQKANSYAPLTYAQTQNLDQYYQLDYLTAFSATPANTRNQYYGFLYQEFTDDALLGNLVVRLPGNQALTLKPYFWKDHGENFLAPGASVRYWPQNKDNYGAVLQYDLSFAGSGHLAAGYWFQSTSPDPPPVSQQNYSVTAQGTLQFASWATLGRFSHFLFSSPFVQLTGTLSDTTLTGGLRYLDASSPRMTYFLTSGLAGLPYSQVFSLNPTPDPNGQANIADYHEWLPNIGLHRQLTANVDLDLSYSRKIARVDYGPQASSFFGAEATFVARGLTLQKIMGALKPEVDDAIDAALAIHAGRWSFTPDLYWYKAHNKEVLVADPATGQSFYQSNASTSGYGIDLSAGYQLADTLSAYLSASAASETYDHDILIAGSGAPATMHIQGNQVPNDPKFTLKAALDYRYRDLTIAPDVRFISARYGLADNSQQVSSFSVADLNAQYDLSRYLHLKEARIGLSVLNLFDRHYIDVISVNEDNLSSTSYYAGAPRTFSATLTVAF